MKKILFFIVVLVVCSYIFNKCDKQKQTHQTGQVSDVQASETPNKREQIKKEYAVEQEQNSDVESLSKDEMVNEDNVTVKHDNYTTTFSRTLKYPVMVEWWLTSAKLCSGERNDDFTTDPRIDESDLSSEYNGCGSMKIDRGHMCPAADNKCEQTWQNECFYFSNIAPQYAKLNRGEWKTVEDDSREFASTYDSIHIWCGSVGVEGKLNSISIPRKCWKLIYIKSKNKYIGYIFDNTNNGDGNISNNEVSKEQIEKLTGYNF